MRGDSITMRKRINISLPEETIALIDRMIEHGDRSRLIDEAVRRYIQETGKANLRKRLKEGAIRRAERDLHLAEEWLSVFERDDTKVGATWVIRAWGTRARASGLAEFESFLGTIDRWLEEITHDFQGRQTSGFVEGFNNRVKVLKRRCDGILHVGRLCQRLTLDLHGYQLFGHT
jgi:transposase